MHSSQDAEEPLPLGLDDLPEECLLCVASHLDHPRDLLSLAGTCRKFSAVVNADEAWAPQVERWTARQDPRSGVAGAAAHRVRTALGLRTLRGACQALVSLRAWPQGLWHSSDPPWFPRGLLLHVARPGTSFALCFAFAGLPPPAAMPPWPHSPLKWRVRQPGCELAVESRPGRGCPEAAAVVTRCPEAGPPVRVRLREPAPGHGEDVLEMSWDEAAQTVSFSLQPGAWLTFRRAGVAAGAASRPPASAHPLAPRPGLYCAGYSIHGMEVVRLEALDAGAPGPPGCPVPGTAPRMAARKLIGDPNVPATKFSFCFGVDPDGARPGPYDYARDDPVLGAAGGGQGRPVFSFLPPPLPPALVRLDERPVGAVFPDAGGQINRVPGTWGPEWVAATVVAYDWGGEAAGDGRAAFGVIFEDEDNAEWRHVMDFWPLADPPFS